MPDIWQTMPDSYTITIKQNVRFQVGIFSEKFQLYQFKMVRCSNLPYPQNLENHDDKRYL